MSRLDTVGWLGAFILALVIGYTLIGPDKSDPPERPGQEAKPSGVDSRPRAERSRTVEVKRVVDGDTILVGGGGNNPAGRTPRLERVRYIGVDTPESKKPNTPVECFAKEAAAFNSKLVAGQRVRLVVDRELRDRYGRTLAYVYVANKLVNAELLKSGHARTLSIPPNTAKAAQFDELERVAKRTKRGLWRACDR